MRLDIENLGPQRVKNLDEPIQALLVHPAAPHLRKAIPLVPSHFEFHLIRPVHLLCMEALSEIGETAGLTGIDVPALSSIIDEPGLNPHRLAEQLGTTVRVRIEHDRGKRRVAEVLKIDTSTTRPGANEAVRRKPKA